MTDLARLLKAATPHPPIDVSLAEVAALRRRRRTLAPLAAAAVVLALAVGVAIAVSRQHRNAAPAVHPTLVTTDIQGLHVRHARGWVAEALPGGQVFLTNAVPATCTFIANPGCDPTDKSLGRDQVLISVIDGFRARGAVTDPNRMVAGLAAHVAAGGPGCITAKLPGYVISVCGGAGVDANAILDGMYLDRSAPKNLGIVVGRSMIDGGAPPGLLRAYPGTVRVGSRTVRTDAEGRFVVVVPEGRYLVDDGGGCPGGSTTVEVRRQQVTTANLTCQAK